MTASHSFKAVDPLKPKTADPVAWAKRTLEHQGCDAALRIARDNARLMVGKDAETKNEHAVFYRNAVAYILRSTNA